MFAILTPENGPVPVPHPEPLGLPWDQHCHGTLWYTMQGKQSEEIQVLAVSWDHKKLHQVQNAIIQMPHFCMHHSTAARWVFWPLFSQPWELCIVFTCRNSPEFSAFSVMWVWKRPLGSIAHSSGKGGLQVNDTNLQDQHWAWGIAFSPWNAVLSSGVARDRSIADRHRGNLTDEAWCSTP